MKKKEADSLHHIGSDNDKADFADFAILLHSDVGLRLDCI
jgi:hypothetical protein